jgi:two-component system nitrogen regulation response regulator GlnG
VRIIAATNIQVEKAVAERRFREDLFYRLNVVRIHLPPLRERREDIPLLVSYFLRKYARAEAGIPKSVSADLLAAFEAHPWPGNVRELENVVQRASVMAKGDVLVPADLPPEFRGLETMRMATAPATMSPGPDVAPGTALPFDDPAALARALFRWARAEAGRKLIPAVERELIIQALTETGGNQVQAARLLGITRATLRKRVEKYHIRRALQVS